MKKRALVCFCPPLSFPSIVHNAFDRLLLAELFKTDPAGHYVSTNLRIFSASFSHPFFSFPSFYQLGFKACAAGVKEQEANNLLEKKFKESKTVTFKEAVSVCPFSL
jgi:20S proteasome alpha/beta subunit